MKVNNAKSHDADVRFLRRILFALIAATFAAMAAGTAAGVLLIKAADTGASQLPNPQTHSTFRGAKQAFHGSVQRMLTCENTA